MENRVGQKLIAKNIYLCDKKNIPLYIIAQDGAHYLCWSPVPNWTLNILDVRTLKKLNIATGFVINNIECVWVNINNIDRFEI
jgi:hypothetical protein